MRHYTSIEQSKKLLSLGLKAESADMHWVNNLDTTDREYLLSLGEIEDWDIELAENCGNLGKYDFPSWSTGALFNILPESIFIENKGSCNLIVFKVKSGYYIYYDYDLQDDDAYFISETGKTLIDAAYNMVVWLLENDYIKKE